MIIIKLFIGYIGFVYICSITGKILEYFYNKQFIKMCQSLTPTEHKEWEIEILNELRHRAYKDKDYDAVDRISELLEETTKDEN